VLQEVDEMYKAAEAEIGDSALLHVIIAQHQMAYHNNLHMEILHLRLAEVRAAEHRRVCVGGSPMSSR
jgi:hypothetical protein